MAVVIPTIKQCRFCGWLTITYVSGSYVFQQECGLAESGEQRCESWHSGGLLPEAYVDANAQEVDDAEYVPECWQTGEAGVVTAQLVRRGKRRRIRRVRMAVRWVDAS